jgi:hypothetical protein
MAHYTGLKELQNNVHKSGFDISQKNLFTAKVGELLPVFWDFAIPDCNYRINLEYFTRTRPVQTSAYTRIREYFDFYAIPIDVLWKSFDTSVIQMGEIAPVQSKSVLNALTVKGDIPFCTLSDLSSAIYYAGGNAALGSSPVPQSGFESIFGYNRGDTVHKLLTYLNYGNFISSSSNGVGGSNRWYNMQAPLSSGVLYTQKYRDNVAVNLFPLLAYQKVYQDFYRWSQWEKADPTAYNVDYYEGNGNLFGSSLSSSVPASADYWQRDNMFSLRYCNWNKDMFMGVLPNSQFGDLAIVDVGDSFPVKVPVGPDSSVDPNVASIAPLQVQATTAQGQPLPLKNGTGSTSMNASIRADLTSLKGSANFSILALRQAEALQKWKEIAQSVDTNYRDQIKAHFGVNVPASDSHMAQYIGGIARNLDISEVLNTNLSEDSSQAYIYGKGVGSGNGSMTYYTGSRYCIIMCIYHAVPLLDYAISGQDGQLLATNIEDLPIPEFDNIGMEAVPIIQLVNSNLLSTNVAQYPYLGYNPRYFNWKTKIDRVHGAFTTDLKDWVAPVDDSYLQQWLPLTSSQPSLLFPFFKVNPNTLDNIFAVKSDSTWATDQLLVNCNIDCKVVRPLSQDGVPY